MSKKIFKGFVQAVIAVLLVFTGICANKGVSAQAADMRTVKTNTTITDSLDSSDDAKYYKFTVPATGYFSVTLKKVDPTLDVSRGWDFIVYDMDGNEICKNTTTTKFTSEKLPFKKGKQFYVKVAQNSGWDSIENVKYYFRINSVATNQWEVEDNDTFKTANVIKSGSTKNANLWNADDVDIYKFVVDKTGYFTVTLATQNHASELGDGFHIAIYDKNFNQQDEEGWVKSTVTTQKYNFAKNTVVYIRISRETGFSYDVGGKGYSIKVTSVARKDWEIETMAGADSSWQTRITGVRALSKSKTYGSLYSDYDNDVYKVVVPAKGVMSIVFTPNDAENNLGNGYSIAIYNRLGNMIKSEGYVKIRKAIRQNVAAGTYYVVIGQQNSWSSVEKKEYSISAVVPSVSAPSVTGLSVKAGTKKATISWTKASGVSGYQIQYSRSSSFKAGKTVNVSASSKTYIAKNLYSNSRYYVRIRSYKKVNGKIVWGKFSSAKSAVVK